MPMNRRRFGGPSSGYTYLIIFKINLETVYYIHWYIIVLIVTYFKILNTITEIVK